MVGARGTVFKNKTGELSLKVTELRLLVKALRPLPEKFHGLADQEQKYRQRYVDLIMSEDTRGVFRTRSRIVQAIREFMTGKGFLEVETPMMQPIPGGANAKPFKTHHNALDMDLFLRVAPELYLKRLVVGGFEKVFEINRNFRNEGISTQHNPEFTMLEFYKPYRDYRYLMDFTEEMLRTLAEKVLGKTQLRYRDDTIDVGKSFERLSIVQAIRKYHPEWSEKELADRQWLNKQLRTDRIAKILGTGEDQKHVNRVSNLGTGALQLALFEDTTEAQLIQPTFIVDYPAEVSPLARRNDENREVTDRFELYIAGREIANGFSELNDPEDQATRFEEQANATAETLCYINRLARRALVRVSLTLCNRRPPWKLKPHVRPTLSSSSPRSRSRCSVSWESAPFLAGFRHRSETRARQARPWLKRPSSPWRSPSPPNEPKKNRPCTRGRNPAPAPTPRVRSRARRFRLLRHPPSRPRAAASAR